MRPGIARKAPTTWLVAASIASASLAAVLSGVIGASVRAPIAPVTAIPEARTAASELPPLDRGGSDDGARAPIASAPAAEAPAELAERGTAIDARVRAAGLAAAIDPEIFRVATFDVHARAIARTLDPETARDLARLAADVGAPAAERVAAAAILRGAPGQAIALPGAAVGFLRDAWTARESDPTLAAAAVGSLAAFGNREDRRALLDESATSSSSAALARAGLSAARGDDAALEIAAAAADDRDPRRAEIAVSALTAIASSDDRELTEMGRSRCAEALARALAAKTTKDASSARLLSALAALDPRKAERPLLAAIADASTSDAGAQSAASALAAGSSTATNVRADLERLRDDARLSDRRRTLVAATLLRSSPDR